MIPSIYLAVTLASVHFNYQGQNQQNLGLGVEVHQGDYALHVGEYRNSYGRTTEYLLGSWQPLHWRGFSAGMFGGIGHGYTSHQVPSVGPVNMALGGVVSYDYRAVGASAYIEPNMVGFQVRVRL